jgi:hypothetical protein
MPDEHAADTPLPPVTPWQPPAIDRPQAIDQPQLAQAIEAPAPARASEGHRPERSIIGDEIRIPILWCEFGQCIESFTHAEALGERDLRARAYEAGWRYDALWRLACPACAQGDSSFWSSRTPVKFSRELYRVAARADLGGDAVILTDDEIWGHMRFRFGILRKRPTCDLPCRPEPEL